MKKNVFSEDTSKEAGGLDRMALMFSGAFLVLFVIIGLVNQEGLSGMINAGFAWSLKYFGAYWQVFLLLFFGIGLFLAFSREGHVVMGGLEKPEVSRFTWTAIIMCTLLAGGGVFWAAAEPISHYVSPPPLFGSQESPFQQAVNALSQSFMHWGFLAWAILGVLSSIVVMHLHYDKGLPLKPRILLYPVFGDRINGTFGSIIDGCCIVAVAAGTIGPIGFLGLQISYSLNALFNIPDGFGTQFVVVLIAVAVYVISALSGLNRGIQILSRLNVILAVILMVYIFLFGPTGFIINGYVEGVGNFLDKFMSMALFRSDTVWLGWWTVFFWGWFMSYGPIMAIFIARISRGRTIRDIILTLSVLAPMITMFWFTIVGGSGLAFEMANPGSVSVAAEGFNLPGTLLAITQQLPLGTLISILFLILTTIFIITTGDSITYTMSLVLTNRNTPDPWIRVFWGIVMGAVAMILISIGSGSISALQSFIVITTVPVSLILLPSLWSSIQIAKKMYKEQNS